MPLNARAFVALRATRARMVKAAGVARRPALWTPLRQGVLAAVEHAAVPFDPGTRTVIDVGASRGQFALFAAERFPSARIVCFEPLEGPRRRLGAVLGDRVAVHGIALGAKSGTAEFNVSARDDSSSLLPIGRRQVREFPGTQVAARVTVPVGRLADFVSPELPAPRLLKIDVQGFELEVLRGAGESLALFDQVFAECSFVELYDGQALADDVVCLLRGAGLRLAGIYNVAQSAGRTPLQADFLFERRT